MTLPNERKPPAANRGDSKALTGDSSMIAEAADKLSYVDHFRARVLQDALTEALRSTWLRRADAFEAARHRPGIDYPGTATVEQLRAKWLELTEKAAVCRNHATVAKFQDHELICEHLRAVS